VHYDALFLWLNSRPTNRMSQLEPTTPVTIGEVSHCLLKKRHFWLIWINRIVDITVRQRDGSATSRNNFKSRGRMEYWECEKTFKRAGYRPWPRWGELTALTQTTQLVRDRWWRQEPNPALDLMASLLPHVWPSH